MKQGVFAFRPKSKPSPVRIASAFDVANLFHAQQVMRDPQPYGGADSFAVTWAIAVLDRLTHFELKAAA